MQLVYSGGSAKRIVSKDSQQCGLIKTIHYSTLSRINWSDHIANSREGAIQLTNCLNQLLIVDPRGLFAGKECLSFVENGMYYNWK